MLEQCGANLFRFAADEEAKVRLSFVRASENIAANTPTSMRNICRYLKSFCTMRTAR